MCTILVGILDSLTIVLFKDLIAKIIDVKVLENEICSLFSMTLTTQISRIKSLNKIILDDSDDRPNRILQINGLHAFYYAIFLKIFDVKVYDKALRYIKSIIRCFICRNICCITYWSRRYGYF